MILSSPIVRRVVVLFSFYCDLVSAAPLIPDASSTTLAITTPAPKIVPRDVQSTCGFTPAASIPGTAFLRYTCDEGPCRIDTYVTPNIAFCGTAARPYTKYYAYGSYPAGGCGDLEACCPSYLPSVHTGIYDQGSTLLINCFTPTGINTAGVIYLSTQLGALSVYLSPIANPTSVSTTNAAPSSTTSMMSATSPPSTSTKAAAGSTASPTQVSSPTAAGQSTSAPSSQATGSPSPQSNSDSFWTKAGGIGTIVGSGIAFFALVIGYLTYNHMKKKRSRNS